MVEIIIDIIEFVITIALAICVTALVWGRE